MKIDSEEERERTRSEKEKEYLERNRMKKGRNAEIDLK